LKWWDELMKYRIEKRFERLIFSRKINKSNDLIIWFINWISSHHIIIWFFMHERFDFESHLLIWNDSYRRFFINLLTSHRVVLQSFNRDDFFQIYWFSRSSRDQWVRKWICDFDEIKSKWQRETKIAWSEEKTFVTNEDLDSQMNLDESEDEKSINRWMKKIFYIISWISHSF
jgi:hypothetical protein